MLAICLKERIHLYFFNIRGDSSSRLRILVLNRQNETCNGSQASCFHSNGIPCVCNSPHAKNNCCQGITRRVAGFVTTLWRRGRGEGGGRRFHLSFVTFTHNPFVPYLRVLPEFFALCHHFESGLFPCQGTHVCFGGIKRTTGHETRVL